MTGLGVASAIAMALLLIFMAALVSVAVVLAYEGIRDLLKNGLDGNG